MQYTVEINMCMCNFWNFFDFDIEKHTVQKTM